MTQKNYRYDLIAYRIDRKFSGVPKEIVAERAPVCAQTIQRILRGENVSVNTLRQFTDFLDLDWPHVFNPKLTERQFHRAVVNGGSQSGR